MIAVEIVSLLKKAGIKASLIGENNLKVEQVAGLIEANKTNISFFNDIKRLAQLKSSQAGIIILNAKYSDLIDGTKIVVENPYFAYALISQTLNPIVLNAGIASSAKIASSAIVPASCAIAENVVIYANVKLGENCQVEAGSIIKNACIIGDNVHIYSNVIIEENCQVGNDTTIESNSVIGGQGFGFANNKGEWLRIRQIGKVIIGNRVWIGNNCSIDRGTINPTIIEDNCIIDNLVHIAHNVEIGYGSAIAGQVGFAGSTKIGKYNIFAGQVGVTGHITTVDNCSFGAKAGLTNNIKLSGSYSGFPTLATTDWQKMTVRTKNLDKSAKKIKELEQRIHQLEQQEN